MLLFSTLDRLRADLDTLRPLTPEQEARALQKFRLEWNYNFRYSAGLVATQYLSLEQLNLAASYHAPA
ncbi:hypothetical protein [Hymenobacter psoromatis]|uniref:hypothetical protein n=1 Tax=Hymenobacter psoromatis TaxID=1484116 RepID=UPI001CBD2304|nr:hypothetical protein [Hymenobacter psoromatis]